MEEGWRSRLSVRRLIAVAGLSGLLLLPRAARAQYTTCTVSPSSVTSTEAWTATNGMVLCGGAYNVQSFNIPSGVTAYVVAGGFVTINATNWIEVTGVLNANYAGGAGANGCTAGTTNRGGSGTGPGGGNGGISEYYGGFGAGGGAYGCLGNGCGGSGGYPVYDSGSTAGGNPYDSNTSVTQDYGSGGGGGGCPTKSTVGGQSGGAGGGGVALTAPQVQIDATGQILANGMNGTGSTTNAGGAGGGGSGGDITVSATSILSVSTSASVTAEGGAGGVGGAFTYQGNGFAGGGGGGGSGGRIKYFSATSCPTVGNVTPGTGGAAAAGSGSDSTGGGDGLSGDLTCTALPALTASASASPSPTTTGTSTTITALATNPSGYLLQYEYDCTGTGTSYSAATTSSSSTCVWTTAGSHPVDVKILGYNAAPLIGGGAAGSSLIASYVATVSVVVGVTPTVSLTVPATGDIGQTISLQGVLTDVNSAATSYTYVWNFGDGVTATSSSTSKTSGVSHVYEAPGTETVTLTTTDSSGYSGAASTTIVIAEVDPTVTIGAIPSPVNAGSPATFSATATSPSTTASLAGFTYVFNFGDGSSATVNPSASNGGGVSTSHTYATPGTYSLQVTATDQYAGAGSQMAMVTVQDPLPSVSLDAPSYSVAIDTALMVTGTAGSTYGPAQAAGFTFVYSWGDASPNKTFSGAPSPQPASHSYDIPGAYTLGLTVTDDTGVSSSTTAAVMVSDVAPAVTVGAIPAPVYASVAASYPASATSPSTTATQAGFTYTFHWGDGSPDSILSASPGNAAGVSAGHTYATASTFELTVTATDKWGTAGSKTSSVTVYSQSPAVGLALDSTSLAVAATLHATGTASAPYAPDGASGFQFVFNWGDGTASTTLSGGSPEVAPHSYDIPGPYTIQLAVTDATGVASTATKSVTVTDGAPSVTIGTLPTPVHSALSSTFSASATSPSNSATLAGFTYVFAWGDGSSNTTLSPTASNGTVSTTHTYATASTFMLTVTATDKYGGSSNETTSVVVYDPKPTLSLHASPTPLAVGATLEATITAGSAFPGDSSAGFTAVITWGDGHSTTVTSASPLSATHVYDIPGAETVGVSVTDATGVAATATTPVTVTEVAPTVAFGPLPSPVYAATTTASFSASATSPSQSASLGGFTYVFNWGDGTADTTIVPTYSNGNVATTHVFPHAGTFSLNVTAADEFHGSGTATASITVLDPIPTAAFGAPTYGGSAGAAVQFTAVASSPLTAENTAAFTWSFNWGDGTSTTTGTSPLTTTHVYDVGGTYTASVTAKDSAGTSSAPATTSVTIANVAPTITQFLHPNGTFGSPIAFAVTVIDASDADTSAGFNIVWNFGDGTPAQAGANLDAVTHTYGAPATYTVTVTATDENNLQATATGTTLVAETVPVVSLGGNQTVGRDVPVTLTPAITPFNPAWTYTYAWTLGDQTTASTPTVTKSYAALGMYTVSLTVTDGLGSTGSTSIVVTVTDTPPVASHVSIAPANPTPQQALTLSYTYADSANAPESGTTIAWYLNSQLAPAYANLLTIPASAVQRNEEWFAVVTPSDGFVVGTAVTSNTVNVGDPPPAALDVTLSPAAPRHADTLALSYTYSDPYAYAESGTTISWTKNTIAQPTLAGQQSVPPPLTKGDIWQATVTPSDGYAIGAAVSSSPVTVQNTPPVLGALPNIAEPAQMLMTSVSWTVSGTDLDNDPLTFDCAIGSTDLGAGPTYTASFPVGTTGVTCTVSDGTATDSGTFQVAIGDVPPTVSVPPNQTINPGKVTLTASGIDPLGRALTYQWTVLSGPSSVSLTGGGTAAVRLTPLAAGDYILQCTVSNGTEQGSAQTKVTVLQLAPLVNLGPGPRTMVAGETITLDGTHSVDPNGGALSYQWAVGSGPVQLSNTTSPTVSLSAPVGGRATVSLTVSDGAQSASGSIVVNVWSGAAGGAAGVSAVVGADQNVVAGALVTLDGTASFDPNAHPLSEAWKEVSGPVVTLTQAGTAQPQFLAQQPGTYVFELTVTDGALAGTATSTVTAVPSMGDQPPVAIATPSASTVQVGGTATIDGTGSTASAGHSLTYQWTRVSGPYLVITGATQSTCQVTPYDDGEVVLQLVVNDGTFSSPPALTTIHATEGTMTAPTAVARASSPALAGASVSLDGSGSSDPNGLPLVYQWQQLTGAPVEIHGSETAGASFTPSASGTASFQLTVFDWIFGTSAQTVVNVVSDDVPIAVAKAPPTAYVGDSVTLDGSESQDPAGQALAFTWTQLSGPAVALANRSVMRPVFVSEAPGTCVFQLTVSNSALTSAPVTVTTQVQTYPTLRGGGGCASGDGVGWMGFLGLWAARARRRRSSRREE